MIYHATVCRQISGLLKDNEKTQSSPPAAPSDDDDDAELKKIKKVKEEI